jgi:transcriptional regulator with XRE-family HTH domain
MFHSVRQQGRGRDAAMKLPDWIRENKTSQGQFARDIGVTQPALSMICAGIRQPSASMMHRIAIATKGGVMPNDFFDFDFGESADRKAA